MEGKQNPLFIKADLLAKEVYSVCRGFPRNEEYGLTSQLRRAALSVILNIVEGFARQGKTEFHRFLVISFGSLKETKYLLGFAKEQNYMTEQKFKELEKISEAVARILWTSMKKVE